MKLIWNDPEMLPVRREYLVLVAGFVLGPPFGIVGMAILRHRTIDPRQRRAQLTWIGILVGVWIAVTALYYAT